MNQSHHQTPRRAATIAGLLASLTLSGALAAQSGAETATADTTGYVGEWTLSVDFQGASRQLRLEILDAGGALRARLETPLGPEPIEITKVVATPEQLTLSYELDLQGNLTALDLVLKRDGDRLTGTLGDRAGRSSTLVSANRGAPATGVASAPAASELPATEAGVYLGNWNLIVDFQGTPVEMALEITEVDGRVAVLLLSPQGEQSITDIRRGDDGLVLGFDSGFGRLTITAQVDANINPDRLTGRVSDQSGQLAADIEGFRAGLLADDDARRRRARLLRRRPVERLRLAEGKMIRIEYADAPADESSAFAQLAGLASGEVVRFFESPAIKLLTDPSLRFGDTTVATGNAAATYPGVYSLWLKRVDDGWRLVFNQYADVWGSQHLPEADVAEIPLAYRELEEAEPKLTLKLSATADQGRLELAWGKHAWSAPFAVVR